MHTARPSISLLPQEASPSITSAFSLQDCSLTHSDPSLPHTSLITEAEELCPADHSTSCEPTGGCSLSSLPACDVTTGHASAQHTLTHSQSAEALGHRPLSPPLPVHQLPADSSPGTSQAVATSARHELLPGSGCVQGSEGQLRKKKSSKTALTVSHGLLFHCPPLSPLTPSPHSLTLLSLPPLTSSSLSPHPLHSLPSPTPLTPSPLSLHPLPSLSPHFSPLTFSPLTPSPHSLTLLPLLSHPSPPPLILSLSSPYILSLPSPPSPPPSLYISQVSFWDTEISPLLSELKVGVASPHSVSPTHLCDVCDGLWASLQHHGLLGRGGGMGGKGRRSEVLRCVFQLLDHSDPRLLLKLSRIILAVRSH